ncbi:hypothetical protein OIV83_004853 [Microbotryomycetes sp. JL201]|nr:hypothetical protein OIV83_004853 [Microbotryomycetes sp. JL201]
MLSGQALRRRIEIACGGMFFLYGYDAGVLGGVLETPQFLNSLGNPSGKYDLSMISSSYTLAAFFATPLVMYFGMALGRRKILLAGCATVVVGAAVQASATTMAHIIVGRIICGFGIGFISTTVPVYQSECSVDKDTRGRKTAITCAWLIGGIPVAYWLDFGMSYVKGSNGVSWRFPIAAQAIPAIIAGIIFLACPDTPRWYYAVGRSEEGDRTLERIWDRPITDPDVLAEKRGILAAIELEQNAQHPRLMDYIYDRTELKTARRLVICFMVNSFQQMMSVNFLVYYATIIYRANGVSLTTAQILGGVQSTIFFAGTIPAIWLIDRVGRRGLMMKGAMIMSVIMLVFVTLLVIPESRKTNASNWAASGLIIFYNFWFGMCWIGAPWQVAPELAPLELRHVGAALNACGEWLFSFVTTFASPIALADPKVGANIWWWFFAFNVLAIPFIYFLVPETAGKNLEELDVLYCKDPVVRQRIYQERASAMAAAEKAADKRMEGDKHEDAQYDYAESA